MHGVVLGGHLIRNVRRGGDQVETELAFQTLRDDLHVQQAEEPASEAEAQRHRRLGLVDERGVVELELVERVAQFGELGVVDREETRVHHGLGVAIAGQRLGCRADGGGHGVADLGLADVLRAGDDVADLAGAERLGGGHVGADDANLDGLVRHADAHHVHLLTRLELTVLHTDIGDDAAVRVVHRVEDQRTRRRLRVAVRSGNLHDDVVEQIGDAFAGLARHAQHVTRLASDQSRDLLRVLVRLGTGQVNLVEHGDDGQIMVDGHVQVGQRLRLDALRRVDEQHRALACGQRARHLIREIHVAGGVDHAERVLGALEGPRHAHGLRFDGDAALLLDVHAVEEAVTHLALRNDAAQLQDAVGHRGLAVVDVCDDAEIPD